MILNLATVLSGYCLAYHNQVGPCFSAKFGWNDPLEIRHKQGVLGSAMVLGQMVGVICGGHLMKAGRRNALLIACFIGIFGVSLTARLNFVTICLGRFLYGTSAGIMGITGSRYVEETTPSSYFDRVAPIYSVSQTIGGLIAYSLGFILPPNNDLQGLIETNRWLIIYFWVPMTLYVCLLLGLLFVVKHDAIKFLINHGKITEAKLHIMQMYQYQDPTDVLKSLSKSLDSGPQVGFYETFSNPKYRRSTVINIIQILFHEMTAINVVKIFSTTLFEGMESATFSARKGTLFIGVVNVIAAIFALRIVKKFGRKTLLVWG